MSHRAIIHLNDLHLQSSVRLYKVAKRMVPEIVTMAIGNIEMGEMMKEES